MVGSSRGVRAVAAEALGAGGCVPGVFGPCPRGSGGIGPENLSRLSAHEHTLSAASF